MCIGKGHAVLRGWTARLLAAAVILAGLGLAAVPPAAAQAVEITLLHVNDTHAHMDAWGPKDRGLNGTLGGLPKAAALLAAEKALDPEALFVHSGDFMDGDLFFNEYLGVAELQLLGSMGLDALVLGNHEFRLGPDFLVEVLQGVWPGGGAPIVGTNIDPQGHALGSWLTRTLILEARGVKVGFLGLLSHKAALMSPAPVKIQKITDYALAQAAVNELRGSGAQVVVCLSHAGLDIMRPLAAAVSGIDVVVNAHDHAVLEQPEGVTNPGGGTTWIVSAGGHYRWVGRLRLLVAGDGVSLSDYRLLSADAQTPPDPALQAAVEGLKAGIVARYGDVYRRPLAWAPKDITLDGKPNGAVRDTPLGNLLADAYRAGTGTDIAIEAMGYIGDPLPKGMVVGADVFRAMSYGNPEVIGGTKIAGPWRLVTFRATGAALIRVLDTTLTLGGDYFPQVSGLRFHYDSSATEPYEGDPFGAKHLIVPGSVWVGWHKILEDHLYSVTVTEGVYKALKYALRMPMQDDQTLDDRAFDAARSFVGRHFLLLPVATGRILDIAARPEMKRAAPERRSPSIA